ncbi:MAG: cysteine peptidase family C39 domain-containing protein, partial [Candidatus Omnitrophica bacterium]|nr:cysteine peptidase family C39 domain-containing protein [Candidatus Omnitrophota bacterium]
MDEKLKEQPKPKFPTWIRAVALLIVSVFLPEQAAWAMGYDPSVLWASKYYLGTAQAGYMANFVAENVRRSLSTLTDKPLGQVEIAPKLVVDARKSEQEPLYLKGADIKKIYNWLRTPEAQIDNYCGVYALHNILKDSGKDITLEELALRVILVDLLSGNIKELKGKLKTSLYALNEVANSLGVKTIPAKTELSADSGLTPFIAHLNYEHFVYVTRISGDMVYYVEKDKEEFIPKSKLEGEFSGYIVGAAAARQLTAIDPKESRGVWGGYTYETVTDRERDRLGKRPGYISGWQHVFDGKNFETLWWDLRDPKSFDTPFGTVKYNLMDAIDVGSTVLVVAGSALAATKIASSAATAGKTINTVGKAATFGNAFGKSFAINMLVNEGFLQTTSYITTGHFNYPWEKDNWKTHAFVAAMSAASAGGSAWANSGKVARLGALNRLVNNNTLRYMGSQAALNGQIYVLTGMTMNAVLGRQAPTFDNMLRSYGEGAAFGAAFGGAFGVATSIAGSTKLAGASNWLKAHQKLGTVVRYAGSAATGAVLFPTLKTLLEIESKGIGRAARENYTNPWNYARGAVIGVGAKWGMTGTAGRSILGKGILTKTPGVGSTVGQKVTLGLTKFAYGGTVGVAAGPGISLIKGDYGSNISRMNWKKMGAETAGAFVLGGVTATYVGMQKQGFVNRLKDYNLAGSGPALLQKQALQGAVTWVAVSPAFVVGRKAFDSVVGKDGKRSHLVELFTTQAGRNELIQGAIMGPRSGAWMKPMIGLLQVQTQAGSPTWWNQGGLVEKGINLGRRIKYSFNKEAFTSGTKAFASGAEKFAAWSVQTSAKFASGQGSALARGAITALKWADSTLLYMPAFVSSIEGAANYIDRGIGMQLTGAPMSAAMKEYVKWLPFFMLPSHSTSKEDIALANRYLFKGKDAEFTPFTPEGFREFQALSQSARQAGGIGKLLQGYADRGVEALSKGDRATAMRLFGEIEKINPSGGAFHINLALTLANEGKTPEALTLLAQTARAMNQKAMDAKNAGNAAEAELLLTKARETINLARTLHGGAAEAKGDLVTAEHQYQRLAQRHPSDYQAFTDLGRVQQAMGKNAQASAAFDAARMAATAASGAAHNETIEGNWKPAFGNAGTIEQRDMFISRRLGFAEGTVSPDQLRLAKALDRAMQLPAGQAGYRILGILEGSKGKTASILISLPTAVEGNTKEGKVTIIFVNNATQGTQFFAEAQKAYGDIYKIGYIGKDASKGSSWSALRDNDVVIAEITEMSSLVPLQRTSPEAKLIPMERIKDARAYIDEADSVYLQPATRITQGQTKTEYSPLEHKYFETLADRSIMLNSRGFDPYSSQGQKLLDLTAKQYAKNFAELGYSAEKIKYDFILSLRGLSQSTRGEDYGLGKAMKDLNGPKTNANMIPDIQVIRGDNSAPVDQPLLLPEAEMNTLRRYYGFAIRPTVESGKTYTVENMLKLFGNLGGV